MTQVTVDGVMQGNGGASDDDRRNGFERGGWAMGVFDNEGARREGNPHQGSRAGLHHAARMQDARMLLPRGAWRRVLLRAATETWTTPSWRTASAIASTTP